MQRDWPRTWRIAVWVHGEKGLCFLNLPRRLAVLVIFTIFSYFCLCRLLSLWAYMSESGYAAVDLVLGVKRLHMYTYVAILLSGMFAPHFPSSRRGLVVTVEIMTLTPRTQNSKFTFPPGHVLSLSFLI